MTPDLLRRCAGAYSSEAGTSGLADGLGVAPSTVRRWLSGAVAMPDGIDAELAAIMLERGHVLREQAGTCDRLAAELDGIEKPAAG